MTDAPRPAGPERVSEDRPASEKAIRSFIGMTCRPELRAALNELLALRARAPADEAARKVADKCFVMTYVSLPDQPKSSQTTAKCSDILRYEELKKAEAEAMPEEPTGDPGRPRRDATSAPAPSPPPAPAPEAAASGAAFDPAHDEPRDTAVAQYVHVLPLKLDPRWDRYGVPPSMATGWGDACGDRVVGVSLLAHMVEAVEAERAAVEQEACDGIDMLTKEVQAARRERDAATRSLAEARAALAGRQGGEALTHELKVWPEFFDDLASERKTFEVRKDDRAYQVGHLLRLQEWSESTGFTGRAVTREVVYLLRGGQFGLATGHVVLGLAAQGRAR